MFRHTISRSTAALIGCLMVHTAAAQSFDLSWNTIDGGGGTAGGGAFQLSGTIGQPDAGSPTSPLTGGGFTLIGGFWQPIADAGCGSCTGDLNGSHDVTLIDLATLLSNFGIASGMSCQQGDIEPAGGDGDVDLSDLALLLVNFGTVCP